MCSPGSTTLPTPSRFTAPSRPACSVLSTDPKREKRSRSVAPVVIVSRSTTRPDWEGRAMGIINTGFGRRRREANDNLPPGQYLTADFPVLSAGPTPEIGLDEWEFEVRAPGVAKRWSWDEFRALPAEDIETDIHC